MERYNLLEDLKQTRKSYRDMVDFCCDALILNNELINKVYDFDIFCGSMWDYQDNDGNYITQEQAEQMDADDYDEIERDVFQYFIINERDAERLAKYTNELVMYSADLDIYLLCVDHYGTSWDYVPSNWKDEESDE